MSPLRHTNCRDFGLSGFVHSQSCRDITYRRRDAPLSPVSVLYPRGAEIVWRRDSGSIRRDLWVSCREIELGWLSVELRRLG